MITKRVLTTKSKVGVGKYAEQEVATLIAAEQESWLRYAYYCYDIIDFVDDVKKAIGIEIEIEKPGTDREAYKRNERIVWDRKKSQMGETEYMHLIMNRRKTRRTNRQATRKSEYFGSTMSKGRFQAVNHGRAFITEK